MRLFRILILVVAVVALAGSANALITFDEFAVGTVVTNQYAAQGVIFAGVAGNAPIIAMDGNYQVLAPNPPFAGDFFAAYFSNPVSWVEFDAGYWDARYSGIIKLYDPSMNLLGQFTNQTIWTEDYTYEHFSFHDLGPIGAVYFNSYNDPAGAAMDNLDFGYGDAAVPEPATIALVGLGLLGLGARLRRR